jgi:hypothetical protein
MNDSWKHDLLKGHEASELIFNEALARSLRGLDFLLHFSLVLTADGH